VRLGSILLILPLAACGARLYYKVGDAETPRAAFGTPYVLAIADFADGRPHEPGDARDFPDGRYRFLPDESFSSIGADVGDALLWHLRFSGLFKKVVRQAPDERAHLLLTGKVRRMRVYAKGSAESGYRMRTDIAMQLSLWRVDAKRPVWVRDFSLAVDGRDTGALSDVTRRAFRGAMNGAVFQIQAALASFRGGPPHPPQEQ
jgi:hypothetical protein